MPAFLRSFTWRKAKKQAGSTSATASGGGNNDAPALQSSLVTTIAPQTPALSGWTEHTLARKVAEVETPLHDHRENVDALINDLEPLGIIADRVAHLLEIADKQACSWIGGDLDDYFFEIALGDILAHALLQISAFRTALYDIVNRYNAGDYGLCGLTMTGHMCMVKALTESERVENVCTDVKSLAGKLTSQADVKKKLERRWTSESTTVAGLSAVARRIIQVGDYDWAGDRADMLCSTGAENILPETPKSYFISTEKGTDPTVFQDYIKLLPDKGNGYLFPFPCIPWQSYITPLTSDQVEEVISQPFTYICSEVTEPQEEAAYGSAG